MREVIMRLTPKAFEDAEHAEILQELVRCKDCIHYNPYTVALSFCEKWKTYCGESLPTEDDDFCSFAERNKVETND